MIVTRRFIGSFQCFDNGEIKPECRAERESLQGAHKDLWNLYKHSNRNVFMVLEQHEWYYDESEEKQDEYWYRELIIRYDDLIEKAVNKILKYYGLV